ncbi:hypothetical protein GALMADRAFT_139215 [Galerina marginata CBS 339.88]|uniref:2-amino-4-hydroxy-6-hydroxymethyldihydropteridine diphosphokinase n=1 Tax=Galerina marginata (strain CBS 339.88) TaxID=685588 RepID=A0A067TDY9_GALM3|nr:hypothetical protein GALMADRAFT_139215 [Galerina marginata CBS 339.88]
MSTAKAPNLADEPEPTDTIRINDLVLPISLHTAQWPLETEQPISISLSIFHNVSAAAQTDDLRLSIDYADIANRIKGAVVHTPFICLQDLSRQICTAIGSFSTLAHLLDGLEVKVIVKQLKAPLHCKTVSIEHLAKFSADGSWIPEKITHHVEDLISSPIIGVGEVERSEEQDVVVNLSIDTGDKGLDREEWIDLRLVTRMLFDEIETTNFVTLEALASYIASETLSILKSYASVSPPLPLVTVRVAKPAALPLARSAEVEVRRTFADYFGSEPEKEAVVQAEEATGEVRLAGVVAERREIQMQSDSAGEYQSGDEAEFEEESGALRSGWNQGQTHTVAIALGSNLGDTFRNIEYALRLLEIPGEILGDSVISLDLDPAITVVNTSFLYESAPMYVTDQPKFVNCACMVETNLSPTTLLRVLKEIESIVGRLPSIRHGPRAVDLDIVFYDNKVVDTRPLSSTKGLDDLEGELVVPHPRMQEREFVLRPLNDMIPEYVHPLLKKPVSTLLREIVDPTVPPMNKVIPFPRFPLSALASASSSAYPSIPPVPETLTSWSYPSTSPSSASLSPSTSHKPKTKKHTRTMATLNTTPDSFSDGAKHTLLSAAVRYACAAVAAGASIIDIGGYSTRPGAEFVSEEEEIGRVVPVIQALRSAELLQAALALEQTTTASLSAEGAFSETIIARVLRTPLSIDTFRPAVARAALLAGANCINDVYGFTGPDSFPPPSPSSEKGKQAAEYMRAMRAVARESGSGVVLMHSRGDAGREKGYGMYAYVCGGGGDVGGGGDDDDGAMTLEGVRVELGDKVEQAVLGPGGVRRWSVVVDPGIGFSKTLEANLGVLRRAGEVVGDVMVGGIGDSAYPNPLKGFPQLIGTSKKSFLGAILAQNSEEHGNGRETQPSERGWATAAAVACAVQQGALVVRVHDVQEMVDVVRVADAIWG